MGTGSSWGLCSETSHRGHGIETPSWLCSRRLEGRAVVSLHRPSHSSPPGHPAVPPILPHREQPRPQRLRTHPRETAEIGFYTFYCLYGTVFVVAGMYAQKNNSNRVQSKKQKDLSQRTFNIHGLHSYTLSTPPDSTHGLRSPTGMAAR